MRARGVGTQKVSIRTLGLLLSALGCLSMPAMADTVFGSADCYTAQYMKLYGYTLPTSVARQVQTSFTPQEADCGQIQVKFEEILYDGQWMYTVASISPQNADSVIVLPGDAARSDPAAGYYGEQARDDNRTFEQLAKDEDKQLLAVYAYIKEFDKIGAYYLDHFQATKEVSILMSGAQLAGKNQSVAITWTVQVYDVDLKTGEYHFQNEYLFPMTIQPLQPYREQTYHTINAESQPFDKVVLVHTPLNTYIQPQWKDGQGQARYSVALINADGQTISSGAPPDMSAYTLTHVPKQLTLSLLNNESGEAKKQLTLIADEGGSAEQ